MIAPNRPVLSTDEMLALRADWYALGQPKDHDYWRLISVPQTPRTWVDPLVSF